MRMRMWSGMIWAASWYSGKTDGAIINENPLLARDAGQTAFRLGRLYLQRRKPFRGCARHSSYKEMFLNIMEELVIQ